MQKVKTVHLVNQHYPHNKFYDMIENEDGTTFTSYWGRIGARPQQKEYPKAKWRELLNQKLNKKGYSIIDNTIIESGSIGRIVSVGGTSDLVLVLGMDKNHVKVIDDAGNTWREHIGSINPTGIEIDKFSGQITAPDLHNQWLKLKEEWKL